jgi:hypothetical protein
VTRLWRYWDGSLCVPWRILPNGEPDWAPPRLLIDWADRYAPRRCYWYGRRFCWTVALERGGRLQSYSWRRQRFTKRWRWVIVYPTDWRERAAA